MNIEPLLSQGVETAPARDRNQLLQSRNLGRRYLDGPGWTKARRGSSVARPIEHAATASHATHDHIVM
jgi:hypothetical protein